MSLPCQSLAAASMAAAPAGAGEIIVSGSLLAAIPLALLAGLLSFASPCVLPLVPGYLSYVTGLAGLGLEQRPPAPPPAGGGLSVAVVARLEPMQAARSRVALGTTLFIAGFTAVFVSYGAFFGGIGAALLEHQAPLTRLMGLIVIVMGLGFIGLIPTMQRDARLHRRPAPGLWGAPLLGALFAIGWTPCIGPTLAAVQSLAITEASAGRGALLALGYCLGLGLPFLVVGLGMERGLMAVAWARRNARGIQMAGGVAMVLLGAMMVTGTWGAAMAALRTWVSGWVVPL
jgi:cytochrome c-type biogenesis protein